MKQYQRWLIVLWIAALCLPGCAPHTPPAPTPTPASAAAYLRTAADHVAAGAYTAAETAYRAAIQAAPNDPAPRLELAGLYRVWQRPQAGLAALDEALRLGASPRDTVPLRLELLALAGDWAQVTAEATARLRVFPDDSMALELLTEAYLRDYQCAAATTIAQRWHETAPTDRNATLTWSILAADTTLLCEVDATLRDSAFCVGARSGNENLDMELGAALIRSNNWPLAACVLTRAVAQTDTVEAHTWLGEALARIGRPAEARAHLLTATARAPEAPLGWLLLGTYNLGQQETVAAREALLRARALDPHNPAVSLALAEATAQTGRYDEVDAWIAAAMNNAPTDANIAKAAARFYLERHLIHAEYPIRAIQSAIQLAPKDGEAQMLLGQFRLITGDDAGARIALDAAVALAPEMGAAHYLRALALQATGDPAAAQQALTRAADLGYQP